MTKRNSCRIALCGVASMAAIILSTPNAVAQTPVRGPAVDVPAIPWGDSVPWNTYWGPGAPWKWNYGMPVGYGRPWYYANPRQPAPVLERVAGPKIVGARRDVPKDRPLARFEAEVSKLEWPEALRDAQFEKERAALEEIVKKQGLGAKEVKRVLWRLKLKLTDQIRKIEQPKYREAQSYLKILEKKSARLGAVR